MIKKMMNIPTLYININQLIGLVGRVFTNGPEDQDSVPGSIIPKT